MRKVLITVALSALVASSLPAQHNLPSCPGPNASVAGRLTSPQDYTLSWPAVEGAYAYVVEESLSNESPEMVVTHKFFTNQTSMQFKHEAINDVNYRYLITAVGGSNCETLSPQVRTFGDPILRRAVRRGIVPVAGSARGANGAVFKTYLRLEGAALHGKVIFHPAGRPASDDDPSIPYDTSQKSEWDDVVATIGQSGIGSLSIVPAENEVAQLPRATVRLYNVASNGIYGANAEMYPAVDFLDVESPFQRIELPLDGNFRVNVGARAILAGSAKVFLVGADGSEKKSVERSFSAGDVIFGSPEAVYGVTVAPGDVLVVSFTRGIVPFYTLTDNRTNDPFVYVQGADRTDIVDQYVK
jgi:hypothetical protein